MVFVLFFFLSTSTTSPFYASGFLCQRHNVTRTFDHRRCAGWGRCARVCGRTPRKLSKRFHVTGHTILSRHLTPPLPVLRHKCSTKRLTILLAIVHSRDVRAAKVSLRKSLCTGGKLSTRGHKTINTGEGLGGG